jgi:hypothetical protein
MEKLSVLDPMDDADKMPRLNRIGKHMSERDLTIMLRLTEPSTTRRSQVSQEMEELKLMLAELNSTPTASSNISWKRAEVPPVVLETTKAETSTLSSSYSTTTVETRDAPTIPTLYENAQQQK